MKHVSEKMFEDKTEDYKKYAATTFTAPNEAGF